MFSLWLNYALLKPLAPKCHIPLVVEKVLGTKPRIWLNSRKANSMRTLKEGEEKATRKEASDKVLLCSSVWHWHRFVNGMKHPDKVHVKQTWGFRHQTLLQSLPSITDSAQGGSEPVRCVVILWMASKAIWMQISGSEFRAVCFKIWALTKPKELSWATLTWGCLVFRVSNSLFLGKYNNHNS